MKSRLDIPGRLAKGGTYYGWYVLAVLFLAEFMTGGIMGFALSVFLPPMMKDLGWSMGAFTGATSLGFVIIGLTAPLVGGVVDRRGARELMVGGSLLTGVATMALSRVTSLWQFYLLRGVIIPLGLMAMSFLVVTVVLSNWFIKKRGRAIGIAGMGFPLAGVFVPLVTEFLIASLGWRSAWVVLGLSICAIVALPAALFIRQRPETMGLLPDGEASISHPQPSTPVPEEAMWTRRQAARTSSFWLLTLTFGLTQLALGGMTIHFIPFVENAGYSLRTAALMVTISSALSLATRPFWGYLVERGRLNLLALVTYLNAVWSIALLIVARDYYLLLFAFSAFGVSRGANLPVIEMMWATYFGRLRLGTVRSLAMPFSSTLGALGPFIGGYLFDLKGNYNLTFAVFAAVYLVGAVVISQTRPPRLREENG